jgi:glutamate formiminotransferase/formiminotetrahydrofolate cyclodeaminase
MLSRKRRVRRLTIPQNRITLSPEMHDRHTSIDQFLTATAARQPTPGGGSVAALAGALAAAIGEMVLNYSVGKKDLAQHEPQLKSVARELAHARELLLQLMVEDQAAYEALRDARKRPADSSERAARLPATILTCIRVPQAIGAAAGAVLELCDRCVDIVNPYLLSDLAVCAELAMATVRSAGYNCRVNLADVTDPADRTSIERTMNQMLAHALPIIQRVIPRIWKRIDQTSGK